MLHILWLGISNGMVRYIPGEGCQVFTKSDGLQSDQFLPNAGIKASDGKIYIGSVNGFNAFYPHQIKTNHVRPPVVITALEIFNKQIPVGNKLLPKSLNQLEELVLSYKENAFSLLYASLSYCTPNKNKYAYKLEGFEKIGSCGQIGVSGLILGAYIVPVFVKSFQTALFCIGLHSFRIRHPLHHQTDREETYG